jgi:anti-sigma factor RsiW
MLRTGKTWQYRREALPIAETNGNSTARLRPVQGISNSRGDGPAFGRFAGYAPETGRPRWKKQISLRPRRWTSRPAVSGSPMLPRNWPSFRSVPAAGTQRNWHRAGATVLGNEVTRRNGGRDAVTGSAHGVGMTERRRLRCSCLRAWAASLLPRHSHNTYCVFGR